MELQLDLVLLLADALQSLANRRDVQTDLLALLQQRSLVSTHHQHQHLPHDRCVVHDELGLVRDFKVVALHVAFVRFLRDLIMIRSRNPERRSTR